MRLLANEPVRSPREPRPGSKWRIVTPLMLLPLLAPSLVLAYACTTDQGPWAANGYFGPGNFAETLELLIPLGVWAASWLWKWEGDYDILEPRAIICLVAGVIGFVICAWFWAALCMAGIGSALA